MNPAAIRRRAGRRISPGIGRLLALTAAISLSATPARACALPVSGPKRSRRPRSGALCSAAATEAVARRAAAGSQPFLPPCSPFLPSCSPFLWS